MTDIRDLVPRMRELRAEGYSSTVRNWWNAGECVDCGVAVEHSNGKVADRCRPCANADFGRRAGGREHWTRERIIAAIQWWAAEYGEPPAVADFNPNQAILLSDLRRTRRAELLIADRQIPWFMTVIRCFGSWNAAIEAAGLTPRCAGGGGGNHARRRSTKAAA